MATQDARNGRLDELSNATEAWAASEERRLKGEVALLKLIMRGRTGAERLNNTLVSSASALTVNEISQFLTGD